MGPADFAPGHGIDVRPHPHIALATVTFLFEGEILHRDSLGSVQPIRPGDVNWMVAGHGIVHSERTRDEVRRSGGRLHGIQSWVALPRAGRGHRRRPSFITRPRRCRASRRRASTCGSWPGTAYGQQSPVGVLSPTLYVAATMDAGATLEVDPDHPERAVVRHGRGDRDRRSHVPGRDDGRAESGRRRAAGAGTGAPGDRRRRAAGRGAPHLVELRRQLGRADGAGTARLGRAKRGAFPEGARATSTSSSRCPTSRRRRSRPGTATLPSIHEGDLRGRVWRNVPLRRGGDGPDGRQRRRCRDPRASDGDGPEHRARPRAAPPAAVSARAASIYRRRPRRVPAAPQREQAPARPTSSSRRAPRRPPGSTGTARRRPRRPPRRPAPVPASGGQARAGASADRRSAVARAAPP